MTPGHEEALRLTMKPFAHTTGNALKRFGYLQMSHQANRFSSYFTWA
jgi:hypothetical protein